MPEPLIWVVPQTAAGQRLDAWLSAQREDWTRSGLAVLIAQGAVCKNNAPAKKNDRLQAGDVLTVSLPEPVALSVLPQNIPLEIVYEDADLLVVNKPQGMVVHPANGHPDGTLVNALLWHCQGRLSSINGVIRPGIVHRIDRDTSGLLIVAKTDRAHLGLSAQIAAHSFTREYEAIACGNFSATDGTVNQPIGRDPKDRQKMCVTAQHSKEAVTHYHVYAQFERHAYLRCRLETGRTHQIRVHLKWLGHPIYGDAVYGKAVAGLVGQCLHARRIGFSHPVTQQWLSFESPLPAYFQAALTTVSHGQWQAMMREE